MAQAQWRPRPYRVDHYPWSASTTVDLAAQGVKFTGNILLQRNFITVYEVETRNGQIIWARVADLNIAPENYARSMLPPKEITLNTDLDFGPNVAQIVDIQCYELRWIFMFHQQSFVATLTQVEQHSPLRHESYELVKDLLEQIINGLNNLVSNGYYHGDLSPDNIYLGQDKKIYIAGYSLVPIEHFDSNNFYIGPNYRYRPPEPILLPDENYHPSTADVFAFGVTLAELATGSKLIYQESESGNIKMYFAKVTKLLESPKRIYEQYKDSMSDDLVDLLQKCLVPSEAKRIKVGLILEHEYFKSQDERTESLVDPKLDLPKVAINHLASQDIIVKKALGSGGFGQVYRVRYKGERRAMKVQKLDGKPPSQAMMVEEDILTHVKHRFLCEAFWIKNDQWAMIHIMELATTDLHGHMIKLGPTRPQEAPFVERRMNRWMYQTCLGLQYMHSRGYSHRDIKPPNILIRANGEACVADFGLAMRSSKSFLSGRFGGTLNFKSPQMLLRHPFNPFANDVWAIGITTHAALTCKYDGLMKRYNAAPKFIEEDVKLIPARIGQMKDFSDLAKDFLSKVCVKDEEVRLNIDVVVSHPWFHSGVASPYDQFAPLTPQKSPTPSRSRYFENIRMIADLQERQ